MRYKPLPRYLRIAHWLHEQGRSVTSQEAGAVFDSSLKTIREDFNKIRKLTDIIERALLPKSASNS